VSAFAGLLRHDGRPADRRDIERLARALPTLDGGRPAVWTSGPAGVACRPYRITPEDRHDRQPFLYRDGRRCLVFAGRLDNRDDLAGMLAIPPGTLDAMSDGALCLAALERWDLDAPARLIGGFAFALFDQDARRVVLCRDPMGGRPLFLHHGDTLVAFATSLPPLLALPEVPRALDEQSLGDLLAVNPFEPRRTFYRGIERVPSGTFATCDRSGVAIREYWRPQRRPLGLRQHTDYVDAARELLDRVVAACLRSERPVSASASGGLDSAGVAATAARLLAPEPLAVYTRVPPPGFARTETDRAYFDERPRVTALAALHPNMRTHFVDAGDPHPFDEEPGRMFATTGFPLSTPANLGWFGQLHDRIAADGHRVHLTGASGNFSLGWRGDHLFYQLLRRGRLGPALGEARALSRTTGRSASSVLYEHLLGPLEPSWLRRARRRARGLGVAQEHIGFVEPAFARAHGLVERIAASGGWEQALRRGDSFDRRVRWLVRAHEFSRDWVGQTVALWGFEMRDPLGDPRIVEFCLNVPEEHFQRGGRPRALQRDVIADRVPPEIRDNYKVGQQCPEWFDRLAPQRGAVLRDIERIARSPQASHILDLKRLRAAADHWPADGAAAEARKVELRYGLLRALHVGRFICWFEGGNA
jgi:asparagine synthase (glutamine-hydrolysing)